MSISLIVTRGFSNGTLTGAISDIVTMGYDIGSGIWTDIAPSTTTWSDTVDATTSWADKIDSTTIWTDVT